MSGFRRAFPYLVAAGTGVISGMYIFKPLVAKEANEFNAPSQTKRSPTEGPQKSQESSNNKDTTRDMKP